jgi:hypothetical protein
MSSRTPSRRTVGLATTVIGVALLGLSLAAPTASAAVGPDVAPTHVPGPSNSDCEDLDTQANAGGQVWTEIDFAPNESGQTKSGVTVTYTDAKTIDWTSTVGVDAVYVKSGSNGSNLYIYAPNANAPESFGDDGLTVPAGDQPLQNISHVSICIDVSNPTTTTSTSSTSSSTTTSSTSSTSTTSSTTSTTLATTTTTEPTTTTTEATTTTTEPTTTTTADVSPTSLVGGIITTSTTADPGTTSTTAAARTEVSGVQIVRQLPRTGTDVRPFAYMGCTMIGVGLVLIGQYRRQTNYEF